MKPLTLSLLSLLLSSMITAQQRAITEPVVGGQIGLLGIWAYSEMPTGYKTVIRGEVGADLGLAGGSFSGQTDYALVPSLTLSPRWYYNLWRRADRGRSTTKNAADFLSLRTTFNPGTILISTDRNLTAYTGLAVLPSWGIRRYWGGVSFETGAGLGYRWQWNDRGYRDSGVGAGIYLRFGI